MALVVHSSAGILVQQDNKEIEMLLHNRLPDLALALAQTDPDEKKHRHELMNKHQISELEAVFMIAEQIKAKRRTAGATN